MKNNYKDNSELDLVNIINILLLKKIKIIFIVGICTIITLSYLSSRPKINFSASTIIDPIDINLENKYEMFNTYGFFKIDSNILLNLYLNELNKGNIIIKTILKTKLYNKDDFENEKKFLNAVNRLAYSIIISPYRTVIDKTLKKDLKEGSWAIKGNYNDKIKWLEFIKILDKDITDKVNQDINRIYQDKLSLEKKIKKFKLEDIESKIKNLNFIYKKKIKDRLAFLQEQLELAKKLEIKKNTLETQSYDSQNSIITNIKTDNPFYLRGYEAIQKEIELIKSRKNNNLYIGKELNDLLKEQIQINEDKKIERAKDALLVSPINTKMFKATNVIPNATKFKYNVTKSLILSVAIMIFIIFAIFYVLIENSINKK